jgi:glutathione S-transferase
MQVYFQIIFLHRVFFQLRVNLHQLIVQLAPLHGKSLSGALRFGNADIRLLQRLQWVDSQLAGKQYLMGDQFSVADGYLFTTLSWMKYIGIDLATLPNLAAFQARVAARPAVQKVLKDEGLA